MPQSEQGVQLQSDTLTSVGAPVRMIPSGANVTIAGAPVQTAQQVVSIADSYGAIVDQFYDQTARNIDIVSELREIRRLLSLYMGVPFQPTNLPQQDDQRIGI